MTAKKRGRGRPKGAPNKPKMELITERQKLMKNADVFEILCQAELVAQDNEDFAINGLKVFSETNGAVKSVLQWAFSDNIISKLPDKVQKQKGLQAAIAEADKLCRRPLVLSDDGNDNGNGDSGPAGEHGSGTADGEEDSFDNGAQASAGNALLLKAALGSGGVAIGQHEEVRHHAAGEDALEGRPLRVVEQRADVEVLRVGEAADVGTLALIGPCLDRVVDQLEDALIPCVWQTGSWGAVRVRND